MLAYRFSSCLFVFFFFVLSVLVMRLVMMTHILVRFFGGPNADGLFKVKWTKSRQLDFMEARRGV